MSDKLSESNPVDKGIFRPDGFTVTYDAVCKCGAQIFRYAAKITGGADGTLRFEGVGTAVGDFLTNRTGFVVLHPLASVSGARPRCAMWMAG